MELRQSLRVLLQHKWMIVLLSISAVVHAVLITYMVSEKYKATTLILLRPQQEVTLAGTLVQKKLLDFPVGQGAKPETSSITYTELIKSRTIAEQVVRNLHLDTLKRKPKDSYWLEQWEVCKEQAKLAALKLWQILKYGKTIEESPFTTAVQDVVESISVNPTKNSYVFEIAFLAKDPSLVAAVVNETASVFIKFLTDVNESEGRLAREFLQQQMEDTERKLANARQAYQEHKIRNKSILFNEEAAEKIKLIAGLESSLEKNHILLSGLLNRFTPENPRVLSLQAENDNLRSRIAQLKTGLETLPATEAEQSKLALEVKTIENTYMFIKKEYEEAHIREVKRTSDISIVSPAMIPSTPVKPIKIYYAGVALALALIIGITFSLFFEAMNTALRTIEEVEGALGLQVLSTIPAIHPAHSKPVT